MNRSLYINGYKKPIIEYLPKIGSLWTPKELWPHEKHKWRIKNVMGGKVYYYLEGSTTYNSLLDTFLSEYRPYE